ncbi:MAG: hypothetical protein HY824_17525 [Acidobacteria bacterium]|nr:hypothetical protein [Acidobacteriota bacterium]
MRSAAIPGVVLALVLSGAAAVSAQSLGEVARQEAERRKAVAAPGKVYTNDTLRLELPPAPASPSGTPAPGAPAAPGASSTPAAAPAPGVAAPGAPAAEPAPLTEADWGKRMTDARAALSRSQIFAEALQSRINALTTDFVNRDDPAQRDAIAAERQKALTELDRVKQEIADEQKAITAVQDDARRAGVPAGWVR